MSLKPQWALLLTFEHQEFTMYNDLGNINIDAHLLEQAANPAMSKLHQDWRRTQPPVVHTEAVGFCC